MWILSRTLFRLLSCYNFFFLIIDLFHHSFICYLILDRVYPTIFWGVLVMLISLAFFILRLIP